MEEDIETAINEMRSGIEAFNAFYEIPVVSGYPPGVEQERILSAEEALGKFIPRSFQVFLSIQDGFSEFDGNLDLFSLRQLVENNTDITSEQRRKISEKSGISDGDFLIIGAQDEDESFIIFDYSKQIDGVDCRILEYDESANATRDFPNLIEFLRHSTELTREAIEGEGDWRDLIDL